LAIKPGYSTPIFLAAGLALVCVYLFGRRALLGVLIGSFFANSLFFFDNTHWSATSIAKTVLTGSFICLGATAGAAAGAYLLHRLCKNQCPLISGRNVFILVVGGGLCSCMISPTCGLLGLALGGSLPWHLFAYSWGTWWIGDAIGVILFAPLLLAWWNEPTLRFSAKGVLEAGLLAVSIALASDFIFFHNFRGVYLVMVLLLWAAFRFGMRGASTASLFIAIAATVGTSQGLSSFSSGDLNDSLLRMYWFLSINVGCSLLVAGVLAERNRSIEALAEGEKIFRAMTEVYPMAIVLANADERNIYFNPTFTQLFGYTADEIPTLDAWLPLAYPDEEYRNFLAEEWQRRTARAIETHSAIEPMESEVTCKDGSTKFVSWGFASLGERNMNFGIDLTERKRAEKQLRESEAAYRATFDQAAMGIVHNSFDGVYIRCNPRFAEIIGYPLEEVPGLTIMQVTPPEERERSAEVLQQLAEGVQETIHWEKRYLRKDGSLTWVRMSTSVRRDSDGHPLCGMSIVEDIQARKEAERRLDEATEALRVSEQRYHAAFKTSLDTIAISRLDDGMIIDVNDTYLEVMGYSREELVEQTAEVPNTWVDLDGETHQDIFIELTGRTTLELNIWVDTEERRRWVEILLRDLVCRNFETQFRCKDGRIFWGLVSASITELDGVPCVLSVIRDISEAKAAAEALRSSEARYRTVFQTSADAVMITGLEDGLVIDVNEGFVRTIGYRREEIIGRKLLEMDHWVDPEERKKLVDILRTEERCQDFETRFHSKDGKIIWGLVSASVIDLDGCPCLLSVTRDITAAKAAEEKIQSLSFYDTLTNLPNRRLLMERLKKTSAVAGPSEPKKALLFVDLDHFKTLNDSLGHPVGDLLLQEVARRLRACLHEDDTVARLGSDEFVVILENLSELAEDAAAQAGVIGERMLAEVAQAYTLGLVDCRCTASIGIVVFGDQGGGPDDLLQQADIAMGQAKAAGRNALRFFAPDLQAAVNARVALEEDLRQAINTNQFLLAYQPQIEDDHLLGAEALIRWLHPQRGMVSPRCLYLPGRGDRHDLAVGRLGAGDGLPTGCRLGRNQADGRHLDRRQRQCSTISPAGFYDQGRRRPRTNRRQPTQHRTGTDRGPAGGKRRRRHRQNDGTQGPRAAFFAR
jgi:diguanylate cyclase (GGDEF)-like protein/PAS domain S-box-containing protein